MVFIGYTSFSRPASKFIHYTTQKGVYFPMTEKLFYKRIGQEIHLQRKHRKDITLEEIGKKLDLSITFLSEVERGKKVSLFQFTRICQILGLNMNEITNKALTGK